MATRTSSQSGNWDQTSTWNGEDVPVNGDTVVISEGHSVVFNVDQSGFSNGLASLVINGTLTFKHDITTYLKMNGNITGTGSLYVGTEENPIQRPSVGSENRCTLMFNSTARITDQLSVEGHGWYPNREWTELNADANLDATQIVLKEDLGLQQGDKIVIGCGSIDYVNQEAAYGIYTVSSYDDGNKIVTLTSGLQKARVEDDPVAIVSRPILFNRTSSSGAIINDLNNISMVGACFKVRFASSPGTVQGNNSLTYISNYNIQHCTSYNYLVGGALNSLIEDCTIVSTSGGVACPVVINTIIRRVVAISTSLIMYSTAKIYDSTLQGTGGIYYPSMTSIEFHNCTFKSIGTGLGWGGSFFNCEFFGDDYLDVDMCMPSTFYNCEFTPRSHGLFGNLQGKLYNCLFNGEYDVDNYQLDKRPVNAIIESFDHNQIEGNYKAWMRGGRIETTDDQLSFTCESDDYPIYRDYPIIAPANRTFKTRIGLTKSIAGIETKLEIIDPADDPLIDDTATPLNEAVASDTTDNQVLGIAYKSDTSKQLILRVSCQNNEGTVLIDTSRIDQLYSYPKKF